MAYVWGLVRSVSGGLWWWVSLFFAYFFQAATFSDYPKFRDAINAKQSAIVMPTDIPLWALVVPFVAWVVARLAHNEAMRYWRAGRVVFDKPLAHPAWHLYVMEGKQVKNDVLMTSVSIEVKNIPYKSDSGADIEDAWVKIELFSPKDYKPLQSWNYARWEDNEHPPYAGNYFKADQNFRTLKANRSPNRITVVVKQFMQPNASRLRGMEQTTGWKDNENPIPPGEYLVRLSIEGKGQQETAKYVFALKNPGEGKSLEVSAASQRIGTYWP